MKQIKMILPALVAILAASTILAGAGLPQASAQANLVQIRMTARKYTFNPGVITVKKGDRVELIITATDHDHGIAIPAFGIKQRLKQGVPTTVTFVASKAGSFTFRCSVFCGMGHRHMKGKLIVRHS